MISAVFVSLASAFITHMKTFKFPLFTLMTVRKVAEKFFFNVDMTRRKSVKKFKKSRGKLTANLEFPDEMDF